ncbi:MAG: hypothetical protein ISS63_05580 [Desulfobacteraceae bacterium]|nr:hypothetical protein [Desulfobacteraceae bacterium]
MLVSHRNPCGGNTAETGSQALGAPLTYPDFTFFTFDIYHAYEGIKEGLACRFK